MSNKIPESANRDALVGAAFVFVSAIAFSAKAIFIKLAYVYAVDAVTLMTLRMLIATPFFIVMALWASRDKSMARLRLRDWLSILALGLAGMYLSQLFDFLGLEYVSAGMERTILFLYPTFVVIFNALLTGKVVGKREVMALLLSYSGIVLVAMDQIAFENSKNTMLGAGFVFISAMTYAGYLVGSGRAIHLVGVQRFSGYTMTVACIAVLAHFSTQHSLSSLALPRQVYVLGFVMAIISTILPVVLLNAGIKKVGSSAASLISSVGPVSTVLLAAVFLQEAITLKQLAGTGLVLAGVLIITLPPSTKRHA